jgi:hypothetical protein
MGGPCCVPLDTARLSGHVRAARAAVALSADDGRGMRTSLPQQFKLSSSSAAHVGWEGRNSRHLQFLQKVQTGPIERDPTAAEA